MLIRAAIWEGCVCSLENNYNFLVFSREGRNLGNISHLFWMIASSWCLYIRIPVSAHYKTMIIVYLFLLKLFTLPCLFALLVILIGNYQLLLYHHLTLRPLIVPQLILVNYRNSRALLHHAYKLGRCHADSHTSHFLYCRLCSPPIDMADVLIMLWEIII